MNNSDQDYSFIAEALPAFVSEAREQIEALEQLLLELEADPGNRELLDALFRCAHTIKGSAGIFGLDRVVAFTHHVETLLDQLRDGKVGLSPKLSTLLLRCNDQISLLVASAQDPGADSPEAEQDRAALVVQLQAMTSASDGDASAPATSAVAPVSSAEVAGRWWVSVHFHADTFRNGMDPLALLNYLRGLGTVSELRCQLDAVPGLEVMDPESCHLGFEFWLETAAQREAIEAAFSFVRDDCTLQLQGPTASPRDTTGADAPAAPRLGELLVAVGSITAEDLARGLAQQAMVAEMTGQAPRLGEMLQTEGRVPPQLVAAAVQLQAAQRGSRGGTAAAVDENRYIRVHADKLDAVINLLGELVIASAGAGLLARQTRHDRLIEANQQIGALVEEIRNGTLQLRMVPIGETFSRFRRVVRDTAAELGKDVQLEIVGGETELDKSVVERIADPLMHLVRNALDHGLETPEQRLAVGKQAQGTLTISACHEAGGILINIQDDGRGIDRQRVLQRAWDRGLVKPEVVPPDEDILKLIFEPGFSTAEKVTNLSGRGVGMDVVRRNIEALRGTVTVSSELGAGSQIALRLPLTLAIIDGFLVGVGASKFIFPLEAVVEVIETRPTASAYDLRGRSVVELRGQALPVVSLRALYGLDTDEPERSSVVVIRSGGLRYGVVVDQLLGQHQTVIKPLGRMFRSLRGMSGSSILGSGEVALIFDVASLGQLASMEGTKALSRGHPPVTPNPLRERDQGDVRHHATTPATSPRPH